MPDEKIEMTWDGEQWAPTSWPAAEAMGWTTEEWEVYEDARVNDA